MGTSTTAYLKYGYMMRFSRDSDYEAWDESDEGFVWEEIGFDEYLRGIFSSTVKPQPPYDHDRTYNEWYNEYARWRTQFPFTVDTFGYSEYEDSISYAFVLDPVGYGKQETEQPMYHSVNPGYPEVVPNLNVDENVRSRLIEFAKAHKIELAPGWDYDNPQWILCAHVG